MRLPIVLRSLISGFVLYVVAAACGAGEAALSTAIDGGEAGAIADAFVDTLVDSTTNPVGEASADPLPPDVVTEQCDKIDSTTRYAVHTFAGKSVEDLSAVRAVCHT